MAQIITLPNVTDPKGSLTIVEKVLPFEIKRVYYIHHVSNGSVRGGHRHKVTQQALICVAGSCEISIDNGSQKENVALDAPTKCLVLAPEDWHTMQHFSTDAVLLVLASEYYDAADYIDEPYGVR